MKKFTFGHNFAVTAKVETGQNSLLELNGITHIHSKRHSAKTDQ
jgi:hypothetical protein